MSARTPVPSKLATLYPDLLRELRRLVPGAPDDRLKLEALSCNARPSITGCTELDPDYRITIGLNPDWAGQGHHQVVAFCGRDAPSPLAVGTVLQHEIAHELVCPRSNAHGEEMRLAAAGILKAGNRYTDRMAEFAANVVADILLNIFQGDAAPDARRYGRGISVAWYDQGASPYSKGGFLAKLKALWLWLWGKGRYFEEYFEVFILCQLPFFAAGPDRCHRLLGRFLRTPRLPVRPRLDQRKSEDIPRSTTDIEKAAGEITALLDQQLAVITEPDVWPEITAEITRILLRFLPKEPPKGFQSHPYFKYHNARSAGREARLGNGGAARASSNGKTGHAQPKPGGQNSAPAMVGEKSAGEAAEAAPNSVVLTDVAWETPGGESVSAALDLPKCADAFYTIEAGQARLDFRARRETAEITARLLSPFRPPKGKTGGLEPLHSILFALDQSGSMGGGCNIAEKLKWGETSPYHCALLAVYAVANWLERQPQRYEINVLTFSNQSKATGWCPAAKVREQLRKSVFNPDMGGTELNPETLRRELPESSACLVLLVSDGHIYNHAAALAVFDDEKVRERHALVLIHTNSRKESSMATAMKHKHLQVIHVPDPRHLPRTIFDTASQLLD